MHPPPRVATAIAVAAVAAVVASACSAPSTATAPASATATPSPTARPVETAAPSESEPAVSPEPEALRWSALDAAGPAPREDHTWTVTGDGRTAILFGGRDGATVHGDAWAYDLRQDAWRQLPGEGAPPARFGHEAAWIDGIGVVIFAGQAGATFFDDLWAFDPSAERWTQLPSGGDVPVARYGSCAALGPDGRLWISHGFTSDGVRFSDTRAYDFTAGAWTDETPASAARPVERCLHGCWWTDDGTLALYAGQTTGTTALSDRWLLADGSWAPVDGTLPPERNLYARTRLEGATLVFGGQALDASYRADLWLLADGEADALELAVEGEAPSGRAGAELIHDPDGDRFLLFGGRSADGGLADLWALGGSIPAP